jgi:hypothetical protein
MLKYAVFALSFMALPAVAADGLNFNPAELCAWQAANNSMDAGECAQLETEAKGAIASLETAADPARKDACIAEAKSFSGDSGFASYTVYASCLKDGPGNL